MFSNAGSWVACHRPGAGVVSTFPVTFDGSEQPSNLFYADGDGWRSTIDPDDFSGGFGVWSGTSFSAPLMAGKLARRLQDDLGAGDDLDTAIGRAWDAVQDRTGIRP